jgi:hypothetical protein
MLKKMSVAPLCWTLLLACIPAGALAQSALPQAPPPGPSVRMLAVTWFGRMQAGQIDRSQLSDELNQKMSDAVVSQISAQLKPCGQPASITYLGGRIVDGDDVYAYILNFKSAKVRELMAVDATGKINGLVFTVAK